MPLLKIGPYKIPIKFVKGLTVEGKPAFGSYSDDPHQIELDKSLKERPEQLLNTVIHEALEAVDCIHVVGLKHEQIEQLSMALTQLLKDSQYLKDLIAS